MAPQTDLAEKDWTRMGAGGVSLVRLGLSWDSIQSGAGRCEPKPQVNVCSWTSFDNIVAQAALNGIRILPAVGGRPEPYREEGSEDYIRQHPPTEGPGLEAWKAFVRSAVERYGRGGIFWKSFEEMTGQDPQPIEEWQVWNEQNSDAYWPPEPDPEAYATLVRATSEAVREADPEAEIVLGGMFGTSTVNSRKYLRGLYSVDGIEEYFDSIAIHPYSPDVDGVEVQARWLREAAVDAGDEDVGLWITELGWSSGEGEHSLESGVEGQAELMRESFELLLGQREAWNIEGVTWFTWTDRAGGGVCEFCREAGVLESDGDPKPSWGVFEEYAGEVER